MLFQERTVFKISFGHALRSFFPPCGLLLLLMAVLPCLGSEQSAGTSVATDPAPVAAAQPENRLLLRKRAQTESTLVSKQGRSYRILVSSPEGPDPPGGFPVIYVLDGDAWFGMAVQIARMREYETLAPALIVAVGYPSHFFFDAEGRTFDFTPPNSDGSDPRLEGAQVGGAAQFLSFLNETLKPWVRESFKVNPSRQALYGHSLGGLFVLYAMFNAPESFDTYLAASPSIGISGKALLKDESAFETNAKRVKPRVMVTVGGLELPHRSPGLEADYRRYYTEHPELIPGQTAEQAVKELFSGGEKRGAVQIDLIGDARELTERLAHSGVRAKFVEFPGEEHMSAGVSALNRGIPFALRP